MTRNVRALRKDEKAAIKDEENSLRRRAQVVLVVVVPLLFTGLHVTAPKSAMDNAFRLAIISLPRLLCMRRMYMRRNCKVYIGEQMSEGELDIRKNRLVLTYSKKLSKFGMLVMLLFVGGAITALVYKKEAGQLPHTLAVSVFFFSLCYYVVSVIVPPLKRLLVSGQKIDLLQSAICAERMTSKSTGISAGRIAAKTASAAMAGAMLSEGKLAGAGLYTGLARFLPESKTTACHSLLVELDDCRNLVLEAPAKVLDIAAAKIREVPVSLRKEYRTILADLRRNPKGPGRREISEQLGNLQKEIISSKYLSASAPTVAERDKAHQKQQALEARAEMLGRALKEPT